MKDNTAVKLLLLIGFFLLNLSSHAIEDLGPRKNLFKIDDVKIRGLKKVEKEAILEKIGSRKGIILDNYLLKKDIQKIYSLKYFESVEAQQENNTLIFVVK